MLKPGFVFSILAVAFPLFLMGCTTAHKASVSVTHVFGNFDVELDEVDDDQSASMERVVIEQMEPGEICGGLMWDYIHGADSILEDEVAGGYDTSIMDGFIYLGAFIESEERAFQMPLRFGVFGQQYQFEDTDYLSVGPKISVEPSYALIQNEGFALRLFGEGNVGFGWSGVDVDPEVAGEDSDNATLLSAGGEVGLRAFFGDFWAGVSYLYQINNFSEGDDNLVQEQDTTFSGVGVNLGLRF